MKIIENRLRYFILFIENIEFFKNNDFLRNKQQKE